MNLFTVKSNRKKRTGEGWVRWQKGLYEMWKGVRKRFKRKGRERVFNEGDSCQSSKSVEDFCLGCSNNSTNFYDHMEL